MKLEHQTVKSSLSEIDQFFRDLEVFSDEEQGLLLRDDVFRQLAIGEQIEGITRKRPEALIEHHSGYQEWVGYNPETLPVSPDKPAEFILPNVPSPLKGESRPFESLREMPLFTQDSFLSDEHLLIPVKQCMMYRVPKQSDPFLYLTASEGSAIIAYTESDVYVAHIGYSLKDQSQAVFDYLAEAGVDASDIHVVASLESQHVDYDRAWPQKENQLLSLGAYKEIESAKGIPEANFTTFTHEAKDEDRPHERTIMEVVIDKDGIFTTLCDYDHKSRRWTDDEHIAKYQSA